jgi:predicted nuclease with RNAse H fold
MILAGIDYGAKQAGTTVIAFLENKKVSFEQTLKKQDADVFLEKRITEKRPSIIGIDAPLSLPLVYKKALREPNFFFRKADIALGAMSPMFLGGLTARAMKFASFCHERAVPILEVYPAALAKQMNLDVWNYKKKNVRYKEIIDFLMKNWDVDAIQIPENTHQLDAILALHTVWRYECQTAQYFGEQQEGLVWV